jgi:hypothetical protein
MAFSTEEKVLMAIVRAAEIFRRNHSAVFRNYGLSDPKHNIYIPTAAETAEWKKAIGPAVEAWMKDDPKREKLLKIYKDEVARAK